MRVSSRLFVPALTILSWSIESTYASFRFPGQGLYKRQVRAADYSTSTSQSYDPNTGAKSPASDPSSPPRSGLDAAPQKSTKARRSTHISKTKLPGSNSRSKKRNYDNEATSAIKSVSHHASQKRQYSDAGKLPDVKFSKRTISAAHHKSGKYDDGTRGKKTDIARRSSIDLNTLHIARGVTIDVPLRNLNRQSLPSGHDMASADPVNNFTSDGTAASPDVNSVSR